MSLNADAKVLAFAAIDHVVLLDLAEKKQKELRVPKGNLNKMTSHVAFRPHASGQAMLATTFDNTVVLWDAKTGEQLGTLEHFATAEVKAIAFSPDGKLLATSGTDFWYIWDVEKREQLFRGKTLPYGLAFSPDGTTLATANNDSTIELWDVATGKEKLHIDVKNNVIEAICYSADGKLLIGGGYQSLPQTTGLEASFKIWDAATGKERDIKAAPITSLESIALSPDGKILASGSSEKKIRLWNLAAGQADQPLGDHASTVIDLAFSADATLLASTGLQEKVRFWDMTTRREFVPHGQQRAESKETVKQPTGQQPNADAGPAETMIGVLGKLGEALSKTNFGTPVFSSDGQKMATLEKGNALALRDVKTWQPIQQLNGPKSEIYTVAFSPDGKLLASGSDDGLTKIWDTATGRELRTLSPHRASVRSLAFSPDNTLLATGSNDTTIRIWDVATGTLQRTLTGYGAYVRSIVFSPDGKTLVNGGLSNKASVWDVRTGRSLRTLAGHNADVRVVIYSPDGKFLFTCSQDATTKIWREADGVELATMTLLGDGDWMVVTPDGLFDGSPAAWQQIIWRFGDDTFNFAPVEIFFADFYYPGLLADILAGKRPAAPSDISQKDRRQPQLTLALNGPATTAPAASRRISVKIDITQAPAGAQDVRLFRNGSLVKVWRGDVLKGNPRATLEATLPIVAGENRLTAYAFNRDNVKSADAALIINGDERLRRQGKTYIVSAGVDLYQPNPFFRNLKYAVADADSFASEVKSQQERLARYEKVEVIKLTNEAATKANILGALSQLAAKVEPEDAVILYFAGHGLAEGGQFYIIPHDFGSAKAPAQADVRAALGKMLAARGISDRELAQAFEGVDGGQLSMIIDACNSGQALGGERDGYGPMNAKGLAQLAYEKGMYILTAAQSFQAAQEVNVLGHGLLTYVLVDEGLKQPVADRKPQDGAVIMREWLDYAASRVPQVQVDKIKQAGARGLSLSFSEAERGIGPQRRIVQHPRVFYRRELEAQPLIVAKPGVRVAAARF
jgi:WD40 repeat protein